MRSYYSHLQVVKSEGEEVSLVHKPTFRSSAIFPVLQTAEYSTRIMFMGYWLLKRKIKEIGLLYTLRSRKGTLLARRYLLIDTAKAFTLDLSEFETEIGRENDPEGFSGSIELEIFSVTDLVFPYPAFVLVYYNDTFSTAVHTVGRIYNDIEDLKGNEEYKVRESGFDIYGDADSEPFIALTNGPVRNQAPFIEYRVLNTEGQEFSGDFTLPALEPYETTFIKLKRYIDLEGQLAGKQGSIKFGHNFEGFFPRFLVGNFDTLHHAISITHSYYDSSELEDEKSYWNRKDESFNDSSVSVPLYVEDDYYTHLIIYPVFSPSDFTLSFDFYDIQGEAKGSLKDYKPVKSADNRYEIIDFNTIIATEKLEASAIRSVHIQCNWEDKTRIPTRLKFGLNVGMYNRPVKIPSNICFAPALGNPNILQKKGTFRWAPFLQIGRSEIILTNSSPLKSYDREANVTLTCYREQDEAIFEKTIRIMPNGIACISPDTDEALRDFLADSAGGWLTANADNPFVSGWYFDFHSNGSVAADHVF